MTCGTIASSRISAPPIRGADIRDPWRRRVGHLSSHTGPGLAGGQDRAAVAGLLERELDAALSGRARAEDAPLGLGDRDVVDAGLPAAHQAVLVELPQLVAVAAPPLAVASWHSYWNRTAIRLSPNAHRFLRSA